MLGRSGPHTHTVCPIYSNNIRDYKDSIEFTSQYLFPT